MWNLSEATQLARGANDNNKRMESVLVQCFDGCSLVWMDGQLQLDF